MAGAFDLDGSLGPLGGSESPGVQGLRRGLGIPRYGPVFRDSQGGVHSTLEKAWEANAAIERMRGDQPCQRILENPPKGK